MRQDTRLSDVLHVLLHMAEKSDPMTSEVLAKRIGTNPAVIRRMLAGLRDQGYVRSEKGHGGGWMLACELSQVTIRDIYNALGRPSLFAIDNRTELPSCILEHVVNVILDEIFEDMRVLLLSRLGKVTLAMLSADFRTASSLVAEP